MQRNLHWAGSDLHDAYGSQYQYKQHCQGAKERMGFTRFTNKY